MKRKNSVLKKSRIWMIALAAAIITAGCSAGETEGEPIEEITETQGETNTMEDTGKMTDVNENVVTSASLPEEYL